jgi:hypothetical protein
MIDNLPLRHGSVELPGSGIPRYRQNEAEDVRIHCTLQVVACNLPILT